MDGPSKKGIEGDHQAVNRDADPSVATEDHQEDKRNRASPARLFKLNKLLVPLQKGVIIDREFGGLLDIAASSMPRDLSQWIMKHYDPEKLQIVIPERGKIPVDAASVHRIWGLPNKGRKVCYEIRPEITKEFYRIFNVHGKNAPTLTAWCKMIQGMDGAHDDDFLRACPIVINYHGYHVTVRELANSMRKEGFLLSNVVQFGILSIIMNLPPDSKKVLMPLKFLIRMQQMDCFDSKEIASKFNKSNRLDRKDMASFSHYISVENIDPSKPVTGNHYWLFNVNIRDQRFEVLDSWRTLESPLLDRCARAIVASFRSLWELHYPKSHVVLDNFGLVNIDVPRQNNDVDCGVYALTIANGWEARNVPSFTPDDIPNIKKQLTIQ
uniref:Ubiquitin-like protease family profile domain-containing protein n=1 Tax=Aegilops tauschii TaxID=37682 RepID=M8CCX1_AEGTA